MIAAPVPVEGTLQSPGRVANVDVEPANTDEPVAYEACPECGGRGYLEDGAVHGPYAYCVTCDVCEGKGLAEIR